MSQIVISVSNMVSFLEQISTSSHAWSPAIDLELLFFLISVHKEHQKLHQKHFPFSCQGQKYNFPVLHEGLFEVGTSTLSMGHTFWWWLIYRERRMNSLLACFPLLWLSSSSFHLYFRVHLFSILVYTDYY